MSTTVPLASVLCRLERATALTPWNERIGCDAPPFPVLHENPSGECQLAIDSFSPSATFRAMGELKTGMSMYGSDASVTAAIYVGCIVLINNQAAHQTEQYQLRRNHRRSAVTTASC